MAFEKPNSLPTEQRLGEADKDKKKEDKKRKKKSQTSNLPSVKSTQKSLTKSPEKSLSETWHELFEAKKLKEEAKKPTEKPSAKELEVEETEPKSVTEPDAEELTKWYNETSSLSLDTIDSETEIRLHPYAESLYESENKTSELPEIHEAVQHLEKLELIDDNPAAPFAESTEDLKLPQLERDLGSNNSEPELGQEVPLGPESTELPAVVWPPPVETGRHEGTAEPASDHAMPAERLTAAPAATVADKYKNTLRKLKRTDRREGLKRKNLERQHRQLRKQVSQQRREIAATHERQFISEEKWQQLKAEQEARIHRIERGGHRTEPEPQYEPAPKAKVPEMAGFIPAKTAEAKLPAYFETLPPEAQEIARRLPMPPDAEGVTEQLHAPEGHEFQRSSWHTIDVDKKTGRAAEQSVLTYGEEFRHERDQETWRLDDEEIPVASGQLAVSAMADVGTLPLPQPVIQPPATSVPQPLASSAWPISSNTTIREARQITSNLGDLALAVVLVIIVVAIIIVARA